MDIYNFNPELLLSLLLTLMRISIVLFLMPVFNTNALPMQVKASVSLVLTLALWPHIAFADTSMPSHPLSLGLMLLGELVLGFIMGMAVQFLFVAIQSGGELLGFQMGFTMVNVADPLSGIQNGAAAYFLWMVSILTFLAFDGHLLMLKALADSFRLVPAGGLLLGDILVRQVFDLSTQLFVIAIKVAAPVMVALFLTEIALGLMNRAAPQMHVMLIGFPLKIAAGFFFLGLLLVILSSQIEQFVIDMNPMFLNLLKAGSPLFHKLAP
ncbi:MAG: flagellar biosynthetic protein FliR [Desulfovibrionaceae bacterium]|nr:flagellar biosynthetic protein FliR [Desulfovibrionaceae bacterium]